jgi:hypothetical protein
MASSLFAPVEIYVKTPASPKNAAPDKPSILCEMRQ